MSTGVSAVNVQVPSSTTAPVIADFVEHALRVAYVFRRDIRNLTDGEWNSPGVYVLLTSDGSGKVYVGKAVKLRQRLHEHRSEPKLPWERAVIVKRDTSHGFNSAEIGYLEGRLSAELGAVDGLTVVKGKTDHDGTLPPHMLLSLDALLPSVVAAIRLAGVDVFKVADLPEANADHGSGSKRSYTVIPGTLADLLAGGILHAGSSLHLTRGGRSEAASVSSSGEVIYAGVSYASPSRAASLAVGGQAANGWEDWRVGSPTGPTLAALRAEWNAQAGSS